MGAVSNGDPGQVSSLKEREEQQATPSSRLHQSCGASSPFMWHVFTIHVARLHQSCGASSPVMWRVFTSHVARLHHSCGASSPFMWRVFTIHVAHLHHSCGDRVAEIQIERLVQFNLSHRNPNPDVKSMAALNRSAVLEFVLIGFPGLPEKFSSLVSLSFFLIYNISLYANLVVAVLILLRPHLHQPMYVIVGNLAVSDLLFDTLTLPKIIAKYWFGDGSLSYTACFIQMFFVHYLGSLDSFIIMVMAIDRYIAVCKPLRYHSIVTNKMVAVVCLAFWVFAAAVGFAVTALGLWLPFRGTNRVKSCFCSLTPVAVLSTADSASSRRTGFVIAMISHLCPFSFIVFSYLVILSKICSPGRTDNWQKAFYTCTTHWLVIGLYFIPRLTVYTYNQVQLIPNADVNVLLICLYTFAPHFTSPVIFCLRTQEIKKTLGKRQPCDMDLDWIKEGEAEIYSWAFTSEDLHERNPTTES
ncbi:olfactory receptor 10D3-like [Mantella aurantiaca]